jgi:hypothetical protein
MSPSKIPRSEFQVVLMELDITASLESTSRPSHPILDKSVDFSSSRTASLDYQQSTLPVTPLPDFRSLFECFLDGAGDENLQPYR